MARRSWFLAALLVLGPAGQGRGQTEAVRVRYAGEDAPLADAEAYVGRALILRGFYAGSELAYDAQGRVKGQPKTTEWTLAGMNLEKVFRRSAGELELDGVRVAIRYNPEQRVFERHPQKELKLRLLLEAPADARRMQAMAAIFSVGIDPALERSMPAYWSHYFLPALGWPRDELSGVTILTTANGRLPEGVVAPVPVKTQQPEFTPEARQDHVLGTVQVRFDVDVGGVPRRIVVRQPLGYGLEASVVKALGACRFQPATQNGNAVAAEIAFNMTFENAPAPHP